MAKVKPPKVTPKDKYSLSLTQLKSLLEYPGHPPMVRALLYLLANTGIRLGESSGVRGSDIYEDSLKVNGKTGERIIPISPSIREMLISIMPPSTAKDQRLFPHTTFWLGRLATRAFKAAGLPGSAHTLRHTFVSLAHMSDQSIMTVTGHRSFSMIQRYSHRKLDKAKEEHASNGPLARLYGSNNGNNDENSHIAPAAELNKSTLQTIVELAREVGELRERNNGNGHNGGVKIAHSATSEYDLANFIGNVRGLPSSCQLANSKFFFHSIVYNFARAIEYKSSSLLKIGTMHALDYFRRINQVPSHLVNFEEPQAIKYIVGMVEMIEALFKNLAAEHYQLAMAYQKLAREERDPEWFDFFDKEDFEELDEEAKGESQ